MDIRLHSTPLSTTGTLTRIPDSGNHEAAPSFVESLQTAFDKINQMQIDSAELARQFAAGETDDLVRVATAAEEAAIALQLAVQVRNKVIEAYQEIMRMQV